MTTPKRNEPCYCGSGLKYKNCHYKQDQQADKDRRNYYTAANFLRRDLLLYARDERFAIPLAEALPFYWNGLYDAHNAEEMSQPEALRFFDWFVFDFVWQDEDGNQRRLGEMYRDEKWEDLSTYQQSLLAGWIEASPSAVYELLSVDGPALRLRQLLSDEQVEVYEGAGAGVAKPGDFILARPVPVGDRTEFSVNAAFLPRDEIGDLPQQLQAARDAKPDQTFVDFWREHGTLPIHHALAEAQRKNRPAVARLDPDRPDKKTAAAASRLRRLQRRRSR